MEDNRNEQEQEQAPQDAEQALQAERDDLLARLQRVSADYINYQKRIQREAQEARQFGNAELIKSLLVVVDDLERAIEHARANHPADDPLLVGTELVYRKALEVLSSFGLTPIAANVGEAFDPAIHEAVLQQPSAEAEPMTILAEAQKGYTLHGRTLRPAKVVVAAPASE